ncbi:uncharacterized protein LOC143179246 [Calliopsis andreniformis]|uniref:uncharacterized protein LOC143179246 n=1 Tax=Calliopsis andreniformis TaxID=337506 RepID=UPI003FCC2C7C
MIEQSPKETSRRMIDEHRVSDVAEARSIATMEDRSIRNACVAERDDCAGVDLPSVVVSSFKRAINVNISPYNALEDLRLIIVKAINYTEEQNRERQWFKQKKKKMKKKTYTRVNIRTHAEYANYKTLRSFSLRRVGRCRWCLELAIGVVN